MTALAGEKTLLEAAQGGDEDAFQRLVDPFRGDLYGRCRRMLGSVHDAEDALQETLLRAWRALPALRSEASLAGWLHRIATNVCLTAIDRRPHRTVSIDETPEGDPARRTVATDHSAVDVWYEQRETTALAVGIALGHLPPTQRAALILRETLGYSAREIASALDTTTASVNSALQRARASVGDGIAASTTGTVKNAVDELVSALGSGDVDAVVGIAVDGTMRETRSWAYSPLPAY